MKRLLILAALCLPAFAQTAVNDRLYLQSSSPWKGQITVTWPAFTNCAGTPIAKGSRSYIVTDGNIGITLWATDCAAPSFAYSVRYVSGGNYSATWSEDWAIPSSPSIVTLANVRQTSTLMFYPSQMIATGKTNGAYCVNVVSEKVTGLIGCAGGPGGGASWGAISGTLTDQADLASALSGKAAANHGHVIADVTALQTSLDGKSNTGHGHAINDTTGLQTALNAKEATANKGQPNGYASLDSGGKVPTAQLPASSGMTALVQDTAPQLGGALDLNGYSVTTPAGAVSPTALGYLFGVTGSLQGQIDGKAATGHNHDTVYPQLGLLTTLGDLPYRGASGWSRLPAATGWLKWTGSAFTYSTPTKTDVGLGNVDNTTDANKPVSTAQQAALDLKAPINNPTFTGVVTAPSFVSNDTSHNGLDYLQGTTSGGVAWSVANVAGTAVTLLWPTDSATATTGYVLAIGGTVTCPTGLPATAPSTCRSTSWAAGGTGGSGTVNSGTAGQFAKYATTGTAVSGAAITMADLPGAFYATSTGSANAYLVAPTDAVTAYSTGEDYCWKANFTNTGAATVNFNSVGAITIRKWVGGSLVDLASGDIQNTAQVCAKYDGTYMQIWAGLNGASALSGSTTVNGQTCTIGSTCTVTADPTSAQYKTRMCEIHIWGTGTSSVLQDTDDEAASCFNGFGVTETITAVKCWANAGSPTVTPVVTGGGAILTGALTCGTASFAAGTLSGTPTVAAGGSIDANITTAGGTATNIRLVFTLSR